MATRVRQPRWARQPVTTPYLTVGDHAPTALALAAVGRLPAVAAAMGRSEAWIYKAAEGARGPEPELEALFPALYQAGVPRERAALLVTRVQTLFHEAYAQDLPRLEDLLEPETLVDTEEDRLQFPVIRHGRAAAPEALLRYEVQCEQAAAIYIELAAACRRVRLARGG